VPIVDSLLNASLGLASLIVGGGIVDLKGIQKAYDSGADLVVIGTAFENDVDFFNK